MPYVEVRIKVCVLGMTIGTSLEVGRDVEVARKGEGVSTAAAAVFHK